MSTAGMSNTDSPTPNPSSPTSFINIPAPVFRLSSASLNSRFPISTERPGGTFSCRLRRSADVLLGIFLGHVF